MEVLVTGGAGYIGSHTVLALLQEGHEVIVLDNLSNSSIESVLRVGKLAGREPMFINGDTRDRTVLDNIFASYGIEAVLHFAGLKAVGESVRDPLSYYENNVSGTITLCNAMKAAGVVNFVFSSSATVYGIQDVIPFVESMDTSEPVNPYGRSKLMAENILRDIANSNKDWSVAVLRYFNPVGAHPSGMIGEDPKGIPNNLLPYITQVAVRRLKELSIYGDDYPTVDGTGVRDYIHVMDLAHGHLKALTAIMNRKGLGVWNLGTGVGYSVLQMLHAFEQVTGVSVPYRISPRRAGDIPEYWADVKKAEIELGWRAQYGITDMMRDSWRWQSLNPNGYLL